VGVTDRPSPYFQKGDQPLMKVAVQHPLIPLIPLITIFFFLKKKKLFIEVYMGGHESAASRSQVSYREVK